MLPKEIADERRRMTIDELETYLLRSLTEEGIRSTSSTYSYTANFLKYSSSASSIGEHLTKGDRLSY